MIVGATDQKLVVNVGKSLSGVDEAFISYIKPNKETGQFVATVTSVPNGIIEYQMESEDDIDVAGNWIFYAEITYFDGKVGYGKPFMLTAKNKGEL